MLFLHRQPFLFVEREKVAQPSGLQFIGTMVDDHERSSNLRGDCVTMPGRSQSLAGAVDSRRESAHKCCIATFADEHHHESRHSRGARYRSTSFRELLGHLSNVDETLGPSRPASARRTPLSPSSSPEP